MAIIFPKKLSRVPYIGHLLCLAVVIGLCAAIFPSVIVNKNLRLSLSLSFISFKFFLLDIPRIRSIGWSPWISLLMLIPGLNSLMQILLFVIPADFFIPLHPPNSDSLMKDILQSVESKKRDDRQDL
jgi:hypothetical protein